MLSCIYLYVELIPYHTEDSLIDCLFLSLVNFSYTAGDVDGVTQWLGSRSLAG